MLLLGDGRCRPAVRPGIPRRDAGVHAVGGAGGAGLRTTGRVGADRAGNASLVVGGTAGSRQQLRPAPGGPQSASARADARLLAFCSASTSSSLVMVDRPWISSRVASS